MPVLVEYLDDGGTSPFGKWFNRLNREAAAEVACALVRLERGYRSKLKSVGAGVFEYKVDFGPGYRVYFGHDGPQLVILLGGGTKRHQPRDIRHVQARWKDYKRRRRSTWH